MSRPDLFFDSSALFAGVVSARGVARALLHFAESTMITITVSEQVVAETERSVARKAPRSLLALREALRCTGLRIVRDPPAAQLSADKFRDIIAHRADLPILVAAINSGTDYLVTHNRRHFIDDPAVAERSGLRIGTPGDALIWVRERISRSRQ
jgi:predicted nucleic acid-binding protein